MNNKQITVNGYTFLGVKTDDGYSVEKWEEWKAKGEIWISLNGAGNALAPNCTTQQKQSKNNQKSKLC